MIRFIQIYPKLTSKKNHTFSQTTPPIFSKTNRIFKSRPSFFKETLFFKQHHSAGECENKRPSLKQKNAVAKTKNAVVKTKTRSTNCKRTTRFMCPKKVMFNLQNFLELYFKYLNALELPTARIRICASLCTRNGYFNQVSQWFPGRDWIGCEWGPWGWNRCWSRCCLSARTSSSDWS